MKVALTMATGKDTRSYGVPMGIGYVGAVVKKRIPHAKILITQSLKDIEAFCPDIIGISSVSSCMPHARKLARQFGRFTPKPKIVLGGPHITALPELLPPEYDMGVVWEGEDAFADICETLDGGGDPTDIAGVCSHTEDGVKQVKPRIPRNDMDSLPFPIRSRNPSRPHEATIFTSRGCPFTCAFCASTRYWAKYRMFTAEYFIDELRHIAKTFPHVRSIYILDDLFQADKKRFAEMVRLLEKTKLNKRFSFHGFIKSSVTDEETMRLLKRMPMSSVRFGLESASKRMLDILKGNSTVDDHIRCIELANKYGIRCKGSWMVGGPGETEADLMESINFMKRWKGKCGTEGFYLATPLPSTPFWDMAIKMGVVRNSLDFDWASLNLDWNNPDFDPSKAAYINTATTLDRTLEILEREGIRKRIMSKHRERLATA